MATHHSITLNAECLTSVKWPFTLTALTFGPCLHFANISYFKDGWAVNFNFYLQTDNRIPNLNASIKAQHIARTNSEGSESEWQDYWS